MFIRRAFLCGFLVSESRGLVRFFLGDLPVKMLCILIHVLIRKLYAVSFLTQFVKGERLCVYVAEPNRERTEGGEFYFLII